MSVLSLSVERLSTPTGRVLIVTDTHEVLRAVDWEDYQTRMHQLLRRHYREYSLVEREGSDRTHAYRSLAAYFDGEFAGCHAVQVETNGTAFQKLVWGALRSIPFGETVSYGALAKQIGRPKAARAVGMANGSNPIAIVVPCHRVIGSNASLTGFGGGLERKRWLLAHEAEKAGQLA